MKYTFEDFLMEKHSEQYVGTDDMMIDDFNDWVQNLGVDELIEYGDKFQRQVNAELLGALKELLSCDLHENLVGGYQAQIETAEEVVTKAEG
jgi:hypothetical protein